MVGPKFFRQAIDLDPTFAGYRYREWPFSRGSQRYRCKWDREFESGLLQRRVRVPDGQASRYSVGIRGYRLRPCPEPAKEVLGVERIAVVADRGYFKIEDIEACEQAGINPLRAASPARSLG